MGVKAAPCEMVIKSSQSVFAREAGDWRFMGRTIRYWPSDPFSSNFSPWQRKQLLS